MNIEKLVRKNILSLKPYTSARSQHLEGILMDANENPFGSSADVDFVENLNRYPDPLQKRLRKAIGEMIGVDFSNIICGVGSDELIDLLIRIFCSPGKDKAMILEPTYGMYKVACDINEVETAKVALDDNFQISFDEIEKNYDSAVKIIFLCSPNNPTGNLINKEDIRKLAEKYESIIIVDEAYADFCINGSVADLVSSHENIIVLRTFSKAWGLAGARLGYCVASSKIIDLITKVKAPYNINKLTEEIIIKAIENKGLMAQMRDKIISERNRLFEELTKIKLIERVFPSDANFILFKINKAKEILKKLESKGIIARDRSSQLKLENSIRVSVGTPEQNDLFLSELKKAIEEVC